MGAIMRGHKQYFVKFVSDRFDKLEYDTEKKDYGTYDHYYSTNASTIKTAKSYISRIRKKYAEENPRNFRIYDSFADIDPLTGTVPVVYQKD